MHITGIGEIVNGERQSWTDSSKKPKLEIKFSIMFIKSKISKHKDKYYLESKHSIVVYKDHHEDYKRIYQCPIKNNRLKGSG